MSELHESHPLARFIEHTLLGAQATARDIERLCQEARDRHFFGVCVNGTRVAQAAHLLEDTAIKVITVAGFPLGANDPDAKRFEIDVALDNGAHEIDAVLNIGRLKDADAKFVLREMRDLVEAAEEHPLKIILETGYLTREEKILACKLAVDAGVNFVKTATGFGPCGATIEDIRLMRETVGQNCGVKASGGIRDAAFAQALLDAGATRLGTSQSVAIVSPPLSSATGH